MELLYHLYSDKGRPENEVTLYAKCFVIDNVLLCNNEGRNEDVITCLGLLSSQLFYSVCSNGRVPAHVYARCECDADELTCV